MAGRGVNFEIRKEKEKEERRFGRVL